MIDQIPGQDSFDVFAIRLDYVSYFPLCVEYMS